jgi:hypothetical protein
LLAAAIAPVDRSVLQSNVDGAQQIGLDHQPVGERIAVGIEQ